MTVELRVGRKESGTLTLMFKIDIVFMGWFVSGYKTWQPFPKSTWGHLDSSCS
jgi:hypothetical protein